MSYRNYLIRICCIALIVSISGYSAHAQQKDMTDGMDLAAPPASLDAVSGTSPEPVTSPDPLTTKQMADEIATINERLALMSAQLAELDLKAKIVQKVAEIQKIESGETDKGNSASPSVESVPTTITEPQQSWPTVRDISGVDGKLRATLRMGDGKIRTVHQGDDVQGWAVKSIKVSGVTLSKGNRDTELDFTYTSSPKEGAMNDTMSIPMSPAASM